MNAVVVAHPVKGKAMHITFFSNEGRKEKCHFLVQNKMLQSKQLTEKATINVLTF